MFTGLVLQTGRVRSIERSEHGARIEIEASLAEDLAAGDSIAVNGVCLTAADVLDGAFSADVMNETLARSSLAEVAEGASVNLELPLRADDRLGGHVVQGHVDGIGVVVDVREDGLALRLEIESSPELLRYIVEKGSVAVDGISLTVAALGRRSFTVSLIPETLNRTNLGGAEPGRKVNLEVDVLAKYVERLVRPLT